VRGGGGPGWKIDELAQRAGIGVDTLRFYQREGLVPPGERRGKSMVYGPTHLECLNRIQELRARHFTLSAIRRMLDEGRVVMLDRLFRTDGRPRTRQQLSDESGVSPELVGTLEEIGFISAPSDLGADDFDAADVRVLQAVRELVELGTPPDAVPVVAQIYVRHLRALKSELIETLAGNEDLGPGLSSDVVDGFRREAARHTEDFLTRWDVIVDYLHHRMIQQLVHLARTYHTGYGGDPPQAPDARRASRPGTTGRIRA
jgi:DNA-binding transcriptional MerR regulator